jgi:hypothetical protein
MKKPLIDSEMIAEIRRSYIALSLLAWAAGKHDEFQRLCWERGILKKPGKHEEAQA